MPEKSLTIAAYAAGASVAAATLVYVFGPTFFLDEGEVSESDRKRVAIGLQNFANDCFINSTLQALAGLPTLRLYLVRELHLRQQDGQEIYDATGKDDKSKIESSRPEWLRLSLQRGVITAALKDILDALSDRPASRRTITAAPFIQAVEQAFKTRVSRYQQDAQEFLQLVMERLADEHNVWLKARERAGVNSAVGTQDEKQVAVDTAADSEGPTDVVSSPIAAQALAAGVQNDSISVVAVSEKEAEAGLRQLSLDQTKPAADPAVPASSLDLEMVFEGKTSSQIECLTCRFKPKSADTTFVTLTLNVPHNLSSTSLDTCLDGMLKAEHIDDFKCDQCRLQYALDLVSKQLTKNNLSEDQRQILNDRYTRIQGVMKTDPEHPPKDLELPDVATSPKRRIARHMRISLFPKVLLIHLSRSVWDSNSSSSKNTAKVAFPEKLCLGSLLDRKEYRLMSMVTHKGGHNSGHYETFRRQWLAPPVVADGRPSTAESVVAEARPSQSVEDGEAQDTTTPAESPKLPPTSTVRFKPAASPRLKATSHAKLAEKKRKSQDKWWRISDEKVRECKLTDVLGMQKEVYLLFYEMVS